MSEQSQTTKPEILQYDDSIKFAVQRFQNDIYSDPQSFVDAANNTAETTAQIKAKSKIAKFIELEFDKETYFDDESEAQIKENQQIKDLLTLRSQLGRMHSASHRVSEQNAERTDQRATEIRNKISQTRIGLFAGRVALWNAANSSNKSLRSAG